MIWKEKTNRGRVVYDRKPSRFLPRDVRRIVRKMAKTATLEPFSGPFSDIYLLIEAQGWIYVLISSIVLWEDVPFIARARAIFLKEMLDWLQADPENVPLYEAVTSPAGGGGGGSF